MIILKQEGEKINLFTFIRLISKTPFKAVNSLLTLFNYYKPNTILVFLKPHPVN